MRIAIVDDEVLFAKKFSAVIRKAFSSSLVSLDVFFSAESLLSSAKSFDLLFLDIEMPGLSGLDLAKSHSNISNAIVFVTNRDDLVFEAYNSTGALGFVRKFNLEQDLKAIIRRVNRLNQQHHGLTVKNGDCVRKIRYSDILYIEKVGHNIVIHTDNESFNQRNTIADVEPSLFPYGFTRTHIGFLVNLGHVVHIKSNCAVLTNQAVVPISRNNVKSVKDKFLERNVLINE